MKCLSRLLVKLFHNPRLSVIVVIYNMSREAPRTLYSLSAEYQQDIKESEYEVVVVDNGSEKPFQPDYIEQFGRNFVYYYLKDASPSPTFAINFGVRHSQGKFVGLMIDGARILSPGVLKYALKAFRLYSNPIVSTLGFHLGPGVQMNTITHGYNQEIEDDLLSKIQWKKNGYKLFDISFFAGSSIHGWFCNITESNCLFMKRSVFDQLGGYDTKFDFPGGGLANLDMYNRVCELSDSILVTILGEGNFHQIHGGVAANASAEKNKRLFSPYAEQYQKIRGKPYTRPNKKQEYIGHIPCETLKSILFSAQKAITLGEKN